jgi:hypothetical protein
VFGQGRGDLGTPQGVDPPSLGNMGTLERLDDPIDTPTESHFDRHKETHKARGICPRMGCVGPRDTIDGCMVDGRTSLFGCTGSTKGHTQVHLGMMVREGA